MACWEGPKGNRTDGAPQGDGISLPVWEPPPGRPLRACNRKGVAMGRCCRALRHVIPRGRGAPGAQEERGMKAPRLPPAPCSLLAQPCKIEHHVRVTSS